MPANAPRPTPPAVAEMLHSAAIHLLRRLRRHDEAMGITAARASALSVAVFAGPVTLGRLARAEQVSAPTMTRLVVAMEKDGLLKREPDRTDRRVVWVRPTAKAARLLTEGRRRRVDSLARELAALDQDDLAALSRAADIIDHLNRQPVEPVAAGRARRTGDARSTRRGRRRFT